ncbi:MAG: AsmA family protein [Pseudomonadota bacterium]
MRLRSTAPAPSPYLQGKLDVDKLDVNPYLGAEGGAAGAAKPAAPAGGAAHAGWSDDPIDTAGLRAANADFTLGVGSIQVRKIQIGASALGLQLKDGRLTADLSKLSLYQGGGQGKLVVDGSGAMPAIDADFKLASVQIRTAGERCRGIRPAVGRRRPQLRGHGARPQPARAGRRAQRQG